MTNKIEERDTEADAAHLSERERQLLEDLAAARRGETVVASGGPPPLDRSLDAPTVAALEARVAALASSPIGRRIAAEAEAERLARRRPLITALAAERQGIEARLAPLRAAEDRAAADLRKAYAAITPAEQVVAAAKAARLHATLLHDLAVTRLERELLEGADPRIDAFIRETLAIETEARSRQSAGSERRAWDREAGQWRTWTTTNVPLVQAVCDACRRARTIAESMRFEALASAAVAEMLAVLRRSIPRLENL